jgi:peptidoglycan hydrolase-like protein with peptidoglycan-binding domain
VDKQPITKEIAIPADYRTITRSIVAIPASNKSIKVPAEYSSITKTVVKTAASTAEVDVPEETSSYTITNMSGGGSYAEWVEEILREAQVTTDRIISIQRALKAADYNPGPIDNILGSRTKSALLQYQKDKNLPQGNLNLETLKSLGVSY